MILHTVTLHNFGIYGGEATFDLTPRSDERFQRPIVLFRGKNGVGKSTLAAAIRLCLHGKLALGTRTRQRDYDAYLLQRLHRNGDGETATTAHVALEFEHVFLGRRHTYRVQRSWTANGHHLNAEMDVWVDGEAMAESEEEKEYLLRELVPVGVAELFFFDGEKIATLSEEGTASADLLADTVKNLLGLHLVEQLDRDLDMYLTRQPGAAELRSHQDELAQLHNDEEDLGQQLHELLSQLDDTRHQINDKRSSITMTEEKIAHEGGRYAENKAEREAEQQALLTAVAQVEQEIQELSRGVMPFSVAPNMLRAVRRRLDQETAYAQWQASQPVVQEIGGIIRESQTEYRVRDGVGNGIEDGIGDGAGKADADDRIVRIQAYLQTHSQPPIPKTEVVHNVSAETRGVLRNWIDEALTTAPQQLAATLQRRADLQAQLAGVEETLTRTPVMEMLRPLQDQLRQLERDLGRLEAEQDRLVAEEQRLTYHLDRIGGSKRRVSEQIANVNTEENRIKLAARTKLLLDDYQTRLTQRKVTQLAAQLRQRFNQLSRKRDFIEKIEIDPRTFGINLFRAGQPFPRTQLSAGEQQIFAIATLWALREVSERPMPVLIDTPLSRLDEDHRRSMLAEFMPQVAQQVIVLATTAEIDDETFAFLQPALSRAYLLEAEAMAAQGREQVVGQQTPLIRLEEVAFHAV